MGENEIRSPVGYYIASKLQAVRKSKNVTQEHLSYAINKSRATIVNIETGKSFPPLETLYLIADALGVEMAELIPDLQWYRTFKNKRVRRVVNVELIE